MRIPSASIILKWHPYFGCLAQYGMQGIALLHVLHAFIRRTHYHFLQLLNNMFPARGA